MNTLKAISYITLILCSSIFCTQIDHSENSSNDGRVYEYYELDDFPVFNGDNSLINVELYKSLKYIDGGSYVDGKVIVSFIVNEIGILGDIRIEKSLCAECDINAIAAVKNLENWTSGKKNKTNVESKLYIPVNFKIM